MRLLYGGTFDPVHAGHLAIARAASHALAQPVFLLPAADPPHRAPPGASAQHRAAMLELAVDGDPSLRVDRRELRRDGPSFTIDTLSEVRAEIGAQAPLVWILGLDSLRQLDEWREWRRIFELAHVLGAERPGTSTDPLWLREQSPRVHEELALRWREPARLADGPAGGYAPLPIRPLREESATEVRRRIAEGGAWEGMLPAAVAHYIRRHGLYGSGSGAGSGAGV
jgi:nicotinate-nucleotide adenylyltransferase